MLDSVSHVDPDSARLLSEPAKIVAMCALAHSTIADAISATSISASAGSAARARQFLPRPISRCDRLGTALKSFRSRADAALRPHSSAVLERMCRACRKLGSRQRHLSFQPSTVSLALPVALTVRDRQRHLCHRLILAWFEAGRVGNAAPFQAAQACAAGYGG